MMHPLLAASVANNLFNDRAAAAQTSRARREAAGPGAAEARAVEDLGAPGELVIRRATAADGPALASLGVLDGDDRAGVLLAGAAGRHAVLVAELDGTLEAARDLDSGLAVADPFRPSARHAELLALRARQLNGDAARRRLPRLGVLHPHTP